MEEPTQLQAEILSLITAAPYGKGLKLIHAAKLLHISYNAAKYQLSKFKKAYPDRWSLIKEMKKEKQKQRIIDLRLRKSLRKPFLIGTLDWGNMPQNDSNNTKLLMDDNDSCLFDSKETAKITYLKIKEKF